MNINQTNPISISFSTDSESDNDETIEIFTKEEEGHIIENAFYLIDSIINTNAIIYNEPDYQEIIINDVLDIFEIQLSQIYEITNDTLDDFKEELTIIIKHALKLFHKHIAPMRSFKRTFIRKSPNVENISSIVTYLQNKPQPEQKSEEWYKFRQSTLTASNIWKAFGSQCVMNQLIYEKCNPSNSNKFSTSIDTPMHWGNKYEPLSAMFYQKRYKTTIGEFGCILHDTYDFIAASPDGINIEKISDRYGRMLEIKNIVNREINGIPKLEYWVQMQMQMEVCNLNECDFLETRFIEYDSFEEFEKDGTFNYTQDNKLKGFIMMFNKGDTPHYVYPPLNMNENDVEPWEVETMEKYNEFIWVKNIYWKLDQFSCVLVLRNKLWFNHAIPVLINIWNIIKREKIEGVSHRAPKKKMTRRTNKNDGELDIKNKCFIDITLFK